MWSEARFSYVGRYYRIEGATLEPSRSGSRDPRSMRRESEAAKDLIAAHVTPT